MRFLATFRRRWWLVTILAVLSALSVSGWVAWERPSRQASAEARRALAAGRYEDAWNVLERWTRARPRAAEAHYLRAKTAIALGRRHDVTVSLKEARALGYPEDGLAVLRALIDARNGRLAEAQPVLARAFAEARAPDLMIDEALARVYLETYDFPHAGAVLTRWARDAPTDPRPPWWRARANLRRDAEPNVVIADCREALRRDPTLAEARLGLADLLRREHRNTEAAAEYDAYLASKPDDPAGHLGAGSNRLELGDLDAARRDLDRALVLDPENAEAHKERAKLDLRLGDAAAALGHLDRAVAVLPHDPALHYSRRLALTRLGRLDEAKQEQQVMDRLKADLDRMNELQARLAGSPHDAHLQTELARWMLAHGYDKEGEKWARKVLGEHPGNPETCLLLADYHERLGQWERAQYYRAQIRRNPSFPVPRQP